MSRSRQPQAEPGQTWNTLRQQRRGPAEAPQGQPPQQAPQHGYAYPPQGEAQGGYAPPMAQPPPSYSASPQGYAPQFDPYTQAPAPSPAGHPQHGHPQHGHPQHGHPQHGQQQHGQPPYPGQPAPAPAGYGQAPGGYVQPQAYAGPNDYAAPNGYAAADQPGQRGYAPQPALSQLGGQRGRVAAPEYQGQDYQGRDNQGYAPAGPRSQAQAQDPRGYDLGSYLPQGERAPNQHAGAPLSGAQADWPQDGHEAYAGEGEGSDYDQGYHDGQPGYGQAQGQGALEAGYDEEVDEGGYEVEEPPRRSRLAVVTLALVGAIAVGGGLAYGYQSLLGGANFGATPLIKVDVSPTKIKPADPGGTQFAHVDSKVMGRLGDGSAPVPADAQPATADSAGSVDPETGTRRVKPLVIGKDGSIIGAGEPAAAPLAPVAVPGMTVVDGLQTRALPPPRAPVQQVAQVQQPLVVAPPQAPPARPAVIARAAPVVTAAVATDPALAAEAPAQPARAAAVPRKRVAAVASTTPASTGAGPASTGAGYVAVLASLPVSGKSRIDALKQFADMQQKYGDALSSRTPDVQEANLGDKGSYHRLLAGPPGSREQANSVCSQLKTAGYTGCWVMSY